MERVTDWRSAPASLRGASVALGNFDGVHAGHQAVVAAAHAAVPDAPLGVVVFTPHPRRFFQPQAEPFRLMSDDARARALHTVGVTRLFELAFDRDLSLMTAERFVGDVLVEALGVSAVTVGFDYRFGKDRGGDADTLRTLAQTHGFRAVIVERVDEGADKCSSTAARAAVRAGDMAGAARLLTRPWTVDGLVARGDQRGRTIGFPTANVSLGALVRPRFGVYAVRVQVNGQGPWRPGVANVGRRPTFDGDDERVEAHIFDFDDDLYGRRVEVSFDTFIRDERKFDSLEALTAQIAEDATTARHILAAHPG